MKVIPLHLHSQWSLLDGVASISEIVSTAQALNLPSIALTDSNALYGAMEFVTTCRQVGMAPILGAELTWVGGHSLVLLAQTMQGYGNLCRLITRLQGTPDRETTLARGLALDDLTDTDGMLALSGGWRSPIDAHVRRGNLRVCENNLPLLNSSANLPV